jgi:Kef-type K+ transport system membrane component KefB
VQTELLDLAAVLAAVALAPPIADWLRRFLSVPLPVVEIVLGILIGPTVLGWVQPGGLPATLGRMGIAVIIYLAGYELDYRQITRAQFRAAGLGWVLSLALGLAAGVGVVTAAHALGVPVAGRPGVSLVTTGVFAGIAVTSTALSTAMPALRDAGETTTRFGRAIVAAGAVGQLAPLLALSVVFGGRELWHSALALVLFLLLVAVAMRVAARGMPAWARRLVSGTMHSSGHFAVRLVVFVLALLTALSVRVFEVDMLVGAFAAGLLVRQLMNGVDEEDRVLTERKVQAIGFGFLTPLFFVTTGIAFDVRGLLAEPLALTLIPVFLLVLFVARGLPGSLVLPARAPARDRVAAMLWTSIGLAVIVVVVGIATADGTMSTVVGSAMIGAGMVSMLTFPTLALAVRRHVPRDVDG